jgi:hypothetical protein
MKNVMTLRREEEARSSGGPGSLSAATVLDIREKSYLLASDDGSSRWGRKADGCLLQPAIRDRVLIWEDGREDAFILSVLIKEGAESFVAFEYDAVLTAPGRLKIRGASVEVTGSEEAALKAPEVSLKGRKGDVMFVHFSFLCRSAFAHMERVSLVMEKCQSVIGRLTQRIRDSFRRVERVDQTRAGMILQTAEERFSAKGRHAVIVAENDVKIDGEKIHIG